MEQQTTGVFSISASKLSVHHFFSNVAISATGQSLSPWFLHLSQDYCFSLRFQCIGSGNIANRAECTYILYIYIDNFHHKCGACLCSHSSRHGSSQEFPRLVHFTCTSSAPALEMHSAQVLEMLAQKWRSLMAWKKFRYTTLFSVQGCR